MSNVEEILSKHVDKQSMDELDENVWPDIVDAMKEYAKMYTLSVAHEAVEEVNEINKSVGLGKNILQFTRGTATYILTRIKSKL